MTKSLLYAALFLIVTVAAQKLETKYEWKYIDYLWESNEQKQQYVRNGDYDYKNIVPIDVDRAKDGRVFITAIRNQGVPASLATVTKYRGPSGPLLQPYPDWSWFKKGDCNGITSVYRVAIDECNRLYVLDTGYIGSNYTCPAQILIFDLGSDRLLERIKIPDNVAQNRRGVGKLVTPVLDVNGPDCELENVFMADVNGRGLVVWNRRRGPFRLEAQVFEPEKAEARVSIGDESFELEDSLMGMALTPRLPGEEGSDLYLRPFASRALYAADTRVLGRSIFADMVKYKRGMDMMPSQATAMAATSQGTLLFGLTKEIAVGCWNRNKDMKRENVDIAVQDKDRLQFASGLKVIPSSRTNTVEEVWIMTNRLQKIMTDSMNFNEVNFRVLKGSVENLVRGTKCEVPKHYNTEYH